ncbi:MAG: polyribonucleotide nucleotidyltransferase [Cytophagales bacterium]|nr:polyribonucleotide nucleotidyltransferase [Cytophagales bacterium]
MSTKPITKIIKLDDDREIIVETGKLAKQADGAVVVKMGETMLLATVVAKKETEVGLDFSPLSVDYQEKYAAGGKIPGGFLKRESRLSEREVLVCRLVDRVIRPLFPPNFCAETQINIYLISADGEALPDALAALAASAALSVSNIPFDGPVSEVRVARVEGKLYINPTPSEIERADIDLIVGATEDNIAMVEGEMNEVSEEEVLEAIQFAHEPIKVHCKVQKELAKEVGALSKRAYEQAQEDTDLRETLFKALYDQVYEVAKKGISNKQERKEAFQAIKIDYMQSLPSDQEVDTALIDKYFDEITREASRKLVLNESVRLDGRKLDEIRAIWAEVDYLPAAHGSSIFTRGETQALTTVTLGNKLDEQIIDGAMVSGYNRFMLHYNFPGFSTGEVKPNRGPGRREIGHGNLAMKSLKKVLPPDEENPYTIRVVSDILESNGSSSMATVCAASLALMDAGVQIKSPVSGIAMGMISDPENGQYAILSDILGDEDALGDMDFKVAGTKNGLRACQMDIKVKGLSYDILRQALAQAKKGRLHILKEMDKTLATPREDYKPHTPRVKVMKIAKDMIGAVIGPGGKVIQNIQKETGATILVEEVEEGGLVRFYASNKEIIEKAAQKVKEIVVEPAVGEVYQGKVKAVLPFGAFVEFLPGKEGLLHISEIKWERIDKLEEVLEIGEEVKVKLIDIDEKTGKYRLSRKVLLPRANVNAEKEI